MPCKRIAGSFDQATQPLLGLTLLSVIIAACPTPGLAQIPVILDPPGQVRSNPLEVEEAYTLGAGDRIRVDVFRLTQYTSESEVLVDGSLNLPLVGNVSVNGMTLEQATTAISNRYGQFLRRPGITVTLLSRRPLEIGISGEVTRPGSYSLTTENSQFPTLTRLLTAAGGITQSADVRQVQIRRPQRSGNEQIINVNLWRLLQTGEQRYDITLRDGDTVFIPATDTTDLAESPLLAAASFAADADQPINVAVVGEVARPGAYTLTGGSTRADVGGLQIRANAGNRPTVTQAIQTAGGIKPMADVRRIQVRRLTRLGAEQVFDVNLWELLQAGDLRQDAILQEGDTIVVPLATAQDPAEAAVVASGNISPATIQVNIVGEVKEPGTVELPPNTPLSQAVLAAGGFNTRARRGSVELVRLNPDGTASRQRFRVDFAEGLDESNNPQLRNNDVIVVNRSALANITDALDVITAPASAIFRLLNIFN